MSEADRVLDICSTITHGVYVIGLCDGAQQNAFTASSLMQVINPMTIISSLFLQQYPLI